MSNSSHEQGQLVGLVLQLEKWKKSQLFHNSPCKEAEISNLEKEKMWSNNSLRLMTPICTSLEIHFYSYIKTEKQAYLNDAWVCILWFFTASLGNLLN